MSLPFSYRGLAPHKFTPMLGVPGEPNAWMSRADHLGFMTGFGLAFPLGIIGICWSVRFVPAGCVNIPTRTTGWRKNAGLRLTTTCSTIRSGSDVSEWDS